MNIKNNRAALLILLAILIGGGLFYWYELRPARIKHDCSWVKKQTNYISEVTQQEADEYNKDCQKTMDEKIDDGTAFGRLFRKSCNKQAKPAEPAKEWWEPASKDEYNFCIHERGL